MFKEYLDQVTNNATAYRIHKDTGIALESIRRWIKGDLLPNIASQVALCERYNIDLYEMNLRVNAYKQPEYMRETLLKHTTLNG